MGEIGEKRKRRAVGQYKTKGLLIRTDGDNLCRCAGAHPTKENWCKNPCHTAGTLCSEKSTDGRRCGKCERGSKRVYENTRTKHMNDPLPEEIYSFVQEIQEDEQGRPPSLDGDTADLKGAGYTKDVLNEDPMKLISCLKNGCKAPRISGLVSTIYELGQHIERSNREIKICRNRLRYVARNLALVLSEESRLPK